MVFVTRDLNVGFILKVYCIRQLVYTTCNEPILVFLTDN